MKRTGIAVVCIVFAGMLLAGTVFAASEPGAGQQKQDARQSQPKPKKAKKLSKRNEAKIEQTKAAEERRGQINKEQSK